MKSLLLLGVVATIILCVDTGSVWAWDDEGHLAAALLAIRNPDVDKVALVKILEQNPDIATFISTGAPTEDTGTTSIAEFKIARAATWPDYVRPLRNGVPDAARKKLSDKYFKRGWHFIDLPYVKPGDSVAGEAPPRENAVTKLDELYKAVLDANTPAEHRANDLCWVLHLVGDIHQPLHAVAMFSATYPKGDAGGNAQMVRPVRNGRTLAPIVLHAYWDELLGTSHDPFQVAVIAKAVAEDPALAPTQFPQFNRDMPTAFMDWAKESEKLAESDVYLNGELKTAITRDFQDKKITVDDVPQLPAGYEDQARKDARKQIALAGLRLGVLLAKVH